MGASFRAVEAHRNGDCGLFCPLCDFEDEQTAADHAEGLHTPPDPNCPDCVDAFDAEPEGSTP